MDRGNPGGGEERWNDAARLLTIQGPIPDEFRACGVAQIEDEDVVAQPPSSECVGSAPTDGVSDSGVALPPALVVPRQACDNGAHKYGVARIRRIPDLLLGIGKAAQHIHVAVVDR